MSQATIQEATETYLQRDQDGSLPHVEAWEARELIANAKHRRQQLLFKFLWRTGARISEALNLTVGDFDFAEHTVAIERLKRSDEFIQTVPLPKEIVSDLRLYAREEELSGPDCLWTIDRSTAYRWCKRQGNQHLDRKITPHMFRHGRVYRMLEEGFSTPVIARAMGHATIKTILNYVHPDPEDIRAGLSV